jgi:phosphoglycolate phosphatase-like HAD superfamily hydrolase
MLLRMWSRHETERTVGASFFATIVLLLASMTAHAQNDPLNAWNDGPAKQRIVSFVKSVTDASGRSFVEPKDRIATFDQDGTLWVEHPLYTQAMFALDRVQALVPAHPKWKQEPPFSAILSDNPEAIGKFTESNWEEIVAATHSGMSTEVFLTEVRNWLSTARHPHFQRRYTDLVYEPMLQLIKYLQSNGFKTYIVTGGGQEFTRAFSEAVYGIPPEQVVGSSILAKYEDKNGKPELIREPKLFFIDDGPGKAVGINLFIGKQPIAAFGNSSGDRGMLEWTQARGGQSLEMLVMHDDLVREYAYGPAQGLPDTKVGTFPGALYDEAQKSGWTVISMKNDWKRIFSSIAPPQSSQMPQ